MTKTLVEQFVEDPDNMRLFQQERAIYEVTELLESVMHQLGVNRTELARRLRKTKGWVTQLLDGEANKTIRTVADAFAILGHEFHASSGPIQIGVPVTSPTRPSAASAGSATTILIHPNGNGVIRQHAASGPPVDVHKDLEEVAA